MKIPGSVAIVTGGARGFGKAFSEALLQRGAQVCFADVNVDEGKKTEEAFHKSYGRENSRFVKCDVSSENEFQNLFKEACTSFRKVDMLVNNAGILKESQWQKTIAVNLMGTIIGCQLALDHMRKDKGGHGGLIVNVASTGGLFPAYFMPSYIASKHGVVGYTRSWAANPQLCAYGISFACLCPAFSETNMLQDTTDADDDSVLVTYVENKENVHEIIEGIGVNKIEDVTSAFLDLVQKEDNNGAVLTVEARTGAKYRFTKHPHRL